MKLNKKVIIDFEAFFIKGKFDVLKLGQTKEWILNNFPNPDGFDECSQIVNENLWTYGNIELYFHEDKLYQIFSDYLHYEIHHGVKGGESLTLKKWFLEEKNNITFLKVLLILNDYKINYQKQQDKISGNIELKLESGVILGFVVTMNDEESYQEYLERSEIESHNKYELWYFCQKHS